ncbi:20079_t:CDS:2, partial [Dentiscutata erythropus]
MSKSKVENLSKSPDKKKIKNDEVKAFESCRKFVDKESVNKSYSGEYLDNESNLEQNNLEWDLKLAEEYKLEGRNKLEETSLGGRAEVCELVVETERSKKGIMDIRSAVNKLEYVDSGVTEYKKKDHRNGKGKMRISEMIKNNEKSSKKKKKYRMGKHLPKIRIRNLAGAENSKDKVPGALA